MSEHMSPCNVERLLVNMHQVDPKIAASIRDRLEMAIRDSETLRELQNANHELRERLGLNKPFCNQPSGSGQKTEASIEWTQTNANSSSD